MKRMIWLSIILIGCLFWTLAGARNHEGRAIKVVKDLCHDSGKLGSYRALIIGINDYKDNRIPDLKTAVNDAKSMAEVLKDHIMNCPDHPMSALARENEDLQQQIVLLEEERDHWERKYRMS